MSRYPVENLLREATEFYSTVSFFALAFASLLFPHLLLLTNGMGQIAAAILITLGGYRFSQGFRIKRYQRRLKAMPYYGLTTSAVPISKKHLFLGRGFLWNGKHTQRLHQIKQVSNLDFSNPGRLYTWAREFVRKHPDSSISAILNKTHWLNPLKPLPPVGGKPYLHGLGDKDKPVLIGQDVRVGHTFVLGTTRVGKTRLASILINQDIRNGDAVIVVDPKGDLDLVRDMYSACLASNRLNDFKMVHLGFPQVSARYNPLKNFDQLTEIATRITDAIAAEGEGKQFADFAWKYVDIVVKSLHAMKEPITYKEIAFYITRLDQLLMRYCDKVFALDNPEYVTAVDEILAENNGKIDKQGNPLPPIERSKAVLKFVKQYVSKMIENGDIKAFQGHLIIELYDAASLDKQYYDKITASIGPVLAKINSSSASDIFSSVNSSCEIELMDIIKAKKVLYIGLDSLSNATVAQDVGKAFLSDLVSTAGKIYKEAHANYRVNIHCDELSEIIQESFVKILNKAGGAGFQVTAYAQTKQDLEVALGSRAMAEMTEGNLNTIIMLRVKNTDTAKVLTDILPKVDVVSHTQVSMVNDTPHGEDHVYFNTSNEDRVQMTAIPMLEPSDVCELPKGQAFVLVNGGELYKIRIPLPINDGLAPDNIINAMQELNYGLKAGDAVEIEPPNAIATIDLTNSESVELKFHTQAPIPEISAQPIEAKASSQNTPAGTALLDEFTAWLEKRIQSNNQQFDPANQTLVKIAAVSFDHRVFVMPEVLAKYQSRSGVATEIIAQELTKNLAHERFYFRENDQDIEVYPVQLPISIDTYPTSPIFKGEGQ